MTVDLSSLEPRILELANQYRRLHISASSPAPAHTKHAMSDDLERIIKSIIIVAKAKQKSYWSKYGIRMETSPEFHKCMADAVKRSKPIGSGFYGAVYSVPALACMRLPKGVKRVAVKLENLKTGWGQDEAQLPGRVKESIAIANKATNLGIGPELYDTFVTINHGNVVIVRIYELLNGKTWGDMVWTPAKKTVAARILQEKIRKMNRAGIIHMDLHAGNVMVTKDDVFIIDFDRSRFVKTVESGRIVVFNASAETYESAYEVTNELAAFVYDKLIEEGTLIMP